MNRTLASFSLILAFTAITLGQSAEPAPKFEIADIHTAAKSTFPVPRSGPARNGRYEIKNASMVDLIRIAYGFDANKIVGGPSWLEMDRFDVIAKVPDDSTAESQKLMLQSLLADRFKLVVRKDTQPLPTYVLLVGKKPLLKEATGKEETGCRTQSASGGPSEGSIRLVSRAGNEQATTITLGPGMTIQYACRNMTMAAFAQGLRGMMVGASLGPNPVVDDTGLKGNWNFDVKWSMQLIGPMMQNQADRITVFEAVDKQLGLKLEQKQIPTPVLVVDSVNEKSTPNAPNVADVLPPIPVPTEFEVADVKPSDPEMRMGRFQIQPGGRLVVENMTLRFLINRAFNTNNGDQIVGLPKWVDTERFNITAKAPSGGAPLTNADTDLLAPMIRSLLVDRFKMTYHSEDRPVSAYSLVAAKPKMKKADPSSRTSCKNVDPPAGTPPGSRTLICQNITMTQFAERLQNLGPGLNWPIANATGIEGGWDVSFTYSLGLPMMLPGGRGGPATQTENDIPTASDPSGGYTIFQAIEKQLGLKLEMQKRPMPVIVIDHLEEKPTEN